MDERADVVIVGAGYGGMQAALALRQLKFGGSVVVVGGEPELPYERPALSKEYLAGDKAFEKLLLRPASFWAEKNVTFRLGERVTEVDAAAHAVRTSKGETLGYGALVWAAGGQARRLPTGGELVGVHTVRDRADVDRMKAELDATSKVVVVGGGYIGLEAASVLRKKGKHVTVLEAQERVLSRVAGVELSRFFEAEHRAQGVEVRLGARITGLVGEGGRVRGVTLEGGEVLAADMVIVGIGITPAVEPLLAAGAEGSKERGVAADLLCKTSLPDVFAVGDCAEHENVFAFGRRVRLESVQNANDQATVVAKVLSGTLAEGERYDTVPWFWSNQFDLRLQTVGLHTDHDDHVVRGAPGERSFSVVYLRDGKVIALDCVNRTKDYVQGKALITSARVVDRAALADATRPLKDLAAS